LSKSKEAMDSYMNDFYFELVDKEDVTEEVLVIRGKEQSVSVKNQPVRGTKEVAKAGGFAGMDSSSKAEGRLDEFVPEELLGKNGKKGRKGGLSQAAAAEEEEEEEEEKEEEEEEESEEEEEVVDDKDVWLKEVTTAFRKRSKQVELAFIDAASTQYDQGAQQAKDDAPYVIAATFEAKPSECICSHCACVCVLPPCYQPWLLFSHSIVGARKWLTLYPTDESEGGSGSNEHKKKRASRK
jgi:hypothetical protein